MQNDLPLVEPVHNRLFSTKTLGSDFLENCGRAVPNFLWVSSPGLHTLPGEKFINFSYHTCLGRSGKYQGRVFECVLNVSTWSSFRTFRIATSSWSLNILSSNSWWKSAQAGIERDRSCLVENIVPFEIRKFRKFKPELLVEWNAPLFSGNFLFPLAFLPGMNRPQFL